VLTLLTGAFLMSLSLFKVDMLGHVAMDSGPPYQMALGEVGSGCLSPVFLGWMSAEMISAVVPLGADL
jgi:hypothetical protein